MHKKPGAGKKTGARYRARSTAARGPVGTAGGGKIGGREPGHRPTRVGDILFRGALSQPGPSDGSAAVKRPLDGRLPRPIASAREQQAWLDWLRPLLPADLAPHLVRVLTRAGGAPQDGELVAFADSPAWCARLRYALLGLEDHIRARDPAVRRARARVLMQGAAPD